jgi:penicillin-binding protein 2
MPCRRADAIASALLFLAFLFLAGSFFRVQVLQGEVHLTVRENRLREVPLPAPRGMILDRTGQVIAENLPGYEISLLCAHEDSLRVMMRRIGEVVPVTVEQVGAAVRRFRRDRDAADGAVSRCVV